MTSNSTDPTATEPGAALADDDDDVQPNHYAETAALRVAESRPGQYGPAVAPVVAALDRLTYAVLGLVTAIERNPGLVVVESAGSAAGVQQAPGALPGPFFRQGGQRYARTADGVVPVDDDGVPV